MRLRHFRIVLLPLSLVLGVNVHIRALLVFLAFQVLCSPQALASDTSQQNISAKIAAIIWLDALGYEKEEFSIEAQCEDEICSIDVFPVELLTDELINSRGCPLKVCVTLTYSPQSKTIVKTVHWR